MIPNIVKGTGISGAIAYAMGQGNDPQTNQRRELVPGETGRAIILGGQNFGFEIDSLERVELARRVMEFQAMPENQAGKTRKLDRDCFHASLSWGDGQNPTQDEMREAATGFLKAVGLEKASAVFIAHDDTSHAHMHIIASRIDPETGRSLTMDNDYIAGQKWAVQWEKEHGQERDGGKGLAALREAVEARDAQAVLSHLTRDKATFQAWEVNRALSYGDLSADDRKAFRSEIMTASNVIALRETAASTVDRYTTREALADELMVQRNAMALAKDERHGLADRQLDRASARMTLNPEQDAALRHLAGDAGIAILWGEAGTGKSHTLNATRQAYEAAGRDVRGLSWTNDVVDQMRGDGFAKAATVASQLGAFEKGHAGWTKDTVLIVDEAAQLSTKVLGQLTAAAKESGAKLILAGDDAQLSSIERGGMFETLRQRHGAAVLQEVQRVQEAEQRAAFGDMHGGQYVKALQTFEQRGGLHWSQRQGEALQGMAERYAEAATADPDKKRFMFAYTNAEVADLNGRARQIARDAGQLGDDHTVRTKHGAQSFAEGDRIQFTANGWTEKEKRAGLVNGRVGTVAGIEVDEAGRARLTVDLDGKKGSKQKSVSFVVGENGRAGEFNGFKHGYAGTIYKGQGKTLDETFVLHSKQWRSSAAYVALTRHRKDVHIFAARETVKDLTAMAAGMARKDNKRAASAYVVDQAQLISIEEAVAAMAARQPAGLSTSDQVPAAARAGQQDGAGAEGADATTGKKAAGMTAATLEEIAGVTERAIETLAGLAENLIGLLGGGSAKPAPQQTPPRDTGPTPSEARAERLQQFLAQQEAERQRRAAELQKIAREIGADDSQSEEQLRDAQQDRTRDRGGGQSL